VLVPAAGGAVARYWLEREDDAAWDWLRPALVGALDGGDPYEVAAAFPLVPYSNRIRDGRFRFDGREVALPRNRADERHAIHGHGWQAAWTATEVSATEARLEYRHAAGAWPWPYRATQRFTLTPASLTVELTLRNEADTPMPAGLGWHPYFPRTLATTLAVATQGMWRTDAEMLPTALGPPPGELAGSVGVDAVELDNGFVGWSRRAVIEWPEHGARLTLTAESPLDFVTVYTPAGRAYFCVEPVSHVTDAVNLAPAGRPDTGLRILAPGETLGARIALVPHVTARP
jgi:aldose 1-epimerase